MPAVQTINITLRKRVTKIVNNEYRNEREINRESVVDLFAVPLPCYLVVNT